MTKPSHAEMEDLWKKGEHKTVAKWLPYFFRDTGNTLIDNLKQSNLLQMRDKLDLPTLTLGADPEFILCEKNNPDKIVMFSSQYTGNKFSISEAEVGADYGLLELRCEPVRTAKDLAKVMKETFEDFDEYFEDLAIVKKEAIEYNHEMARIKEALELVRNGGEAPAYGGYHGKECSVWSTDNDIKIDESVEITLSAYGKPEFKKYRPDILSAGGHIHIGGTFVKCLSIPQLNSLIQKFDQKILPMVDTVATPAAELRKTVYGAPGEYRLKEYGIEYRSPSNAIFWPENNKLLEEILQIIVDETTSHLLT